MPLRPSLRLNPDDFGSWLPQYGRLQTTANDTSWLHRARKAGCNIVTRISGIPASLFLPH